MSKKQITGTITNEDGSSVQYTGEITILDAPVFSSVTVVPNPAPSGTLRTITIVASDPQEQHLTYTCNVDGAPATPTNQPNVFTWQG